MIARKATSILCAVSLFTFSAHALAENCVSRYEAEEALSTKNAKSAAGKAMGGTAGVGLVTIGTIIFGGLTAGVGVLAIGSGATLYYIITKKNENAPVVEEVKVLNLYRQAKKCEGNRCRKTADMDPLLRALVEKGLDEIKKGSDKIPESTKLKIPETIVTMMESGALCVGDKLPNALDLAKMLSVAHEMPDVQIQDGSGGGT